MNVFEPVYKEEKHFDNVVLVNGLPYCKKHGAMNKVSVFKDGFGGFWRCIHVVSKQNDNCCRTSCVQHLK